MFIYCELGVGRGIPGDAPVRPETGPGPVLRGSGAVPAADEWKSTESAWYLARK